MAAYPQRRRLDQGPCISAFPLRRKVGLARLHLRHHCSCRLTCRRRRLARGVSVLDFPLPAVGINSKESLSGARIYSLLHELVHIALTIGKEETVALREPRNDTQWMEVERFAEEAASEAIIPQSALEQQLRGMRKLSMTLRHRG